MDEKLTDLIYSKLNNETEEPRHYIGASSIGHQCERYLWYEFHEPIHKQFSVKQKLTFKIGHYLEKMLIDVLSSIDDVTISKAAPFNDYLKVNSDELEVFQGHMDGIITFSGISAVLEIKTARDSSFRIFKNKGLYAWSPLYYSQVQSYMGMSEYIHAIVIAINKDTSELQVEHVKYDDIFYSSLVSKAQSIIESKEPLSRINNSPLFFKCRLCPYKEKCHVCV